MNNKIVMAILLSSLFITPLVHANCGNGNGNGNGCSDGGNDNDGGNVGPVGPQGPKGNTGLQGQTGLNGTNGTNGLNVTDGKPEARLLGELDLRLWDTKHTSFYAFDSYGFDDRPNHDVLSDARNAFYGAKLVIKLGSSYEERLLEKQGAQIRVLENLVRKLSK